MQISGFVPYTSYFSHFGERDAGETEEKSRCAWPCTGLNFIHGSGAILWVDNE